MHVQQGYKRVLDPDYTGPLRAPVVSLYDIDLKTYNPSGEYEIGHTNGSTTLRQSQSLVQTVQLGGAPYNFTLTVDDHSDDLHFAFQGWTGKR